MSPAPIHRLGTPDRPLRAHSIEIDPPNWLTDFLATRPPRLREPESAIALARENIERGTGGPFGALDCIRDCLRADAVDVLRTYVGSGGIIYGPRSGPRQ